RPVQQNRFIQTVPLHPPHLRQRNRRLPQLRQRLHQKPYLHKRLHPPWHGRPQPHRAR
ncbi:hypothetical protein HK104_003196, partial [Borealophlyctis nickersoniae]